MRSISSKSASSAGLSVEAPSGGGAAGISVMAGLAGDSETLPAGVATALTGGVDGSAVSIAEGAGGAAEVAPGAACSESAALRGETRAAAAESAGFFGNTRAAAAESAESLGKMVEDEGLPAGNVATYGAWSASAEITRRNFFRQPWQCGPNRPGRVPLSTITNLQYGHATSMRLTPAIKMMRGPFRSALKPPWI